MPRLKLSEREANRKIFDDAVHDYIRRRGLTVAKVADKLDVSKSSMQKYINTPGEMRIDKLLGLANLLNVDAGALLMLYAKGDDGTSTLRRRIDAEARP